MKKNKHFDAVKETKIRVRRFLAMLFDWYVSSMLAVLPITFYLRESNVVESSTYALDTYGLQTGLMVGIYAIFVGLLYYFVVPTFIYKGQTLGKKIFKVKVVQFDGSDVTFKTMFKREVIGSILVEGGIVMTAVYSRRIIALVGFSGAVGIMQNVAFAITFLSIVYAYFNKKSQSFHDKIANTLVIRM